MKRQILAFEAIEGERNIEVRRLFNGYVLGLISGGHISGGKKIGEGLEKCVYDTNYGLGKIPKLPSDQVNVVLSREAYQTEHQAQKMMTHLLHPQVQHQIMITLSEPIRTNLPLPKSCTSEAQYAQQIYLARSQKGSTSARFDTRQDFGKAVINLVYGLFILHSHHIIHGDIKIASGANNIIRSQGLYKMIDLGVMMTFKQFQHGLNHPKSPKGKQLWAFRKYKFWSVGHVYAMLHPGDVKQVCQQHQLKWSDLEKVYFENIDLMGFMQSIKRLIYANPHLNLKSLWEQLQAKPTDFSSSAYKLRQVAAQGAKAMRHKIDRSPMTELFLPLDQIYQRIRSFCQLNELSPDLKKYLKIK